ncbi:50S ribosome-binding GTPase [candidate division WOR-3 bacterium]|nr:50S ribosome-binding GTPase [candidate division WOR-3 bacterium]
MPANLPPQYFEAEARYRLTANPREKIEILREMLGIMPHHKGTDKLQADLRARISKLNKEMQKKHTKRRHTYHINKEGVAQLVLLGLANTGKSQILKALTNATPEVASYPFTTNAPIIGMMEFKNIQIQLVDTPAINHDFMLKWLSDIVRPADILLFVVDLSRTGFQPVSNYAVRQASSLSTITERLEKIKIIIETFIPPEPSIEYVFKKAIIIGNKIDLPHVNENFDKLKNKYPNIPIIAISAERKTGLQELKNKIYQSLNIIRVYTKAPGEKPDMNEPIVLPKGSRVIDAARDIHKDFVGELKYARLWGSNKFDGQMVERDYILKEGDVIEFHL